MARKKSKRVESGYALFDVLYEEVSRSSNRRVPRSILGGLDGTSLPGKPLRSRTTPLLRKPIAGAFRSGRLPAHQPSDRCPSPADVWSCLSSRRIWRMLQEKTQCQSRPTEHERRVTSPVKQAYQQSEKQVLGQQRA